MKRKYIPKISILLLSLSFVFLTNCKEERVSISLPFPTKIYKTSGDYFKYANTWGHNNGPYFLTLDDSRVYVDNDDTVYTMRWKLVNDYIISYESSIDDYFTNITYAEIVAYNESHVDSMPLDLFFDRVIDTNPFVEYYVDENYLFRSIDSIDIQKLNKIITDGELEKYFKKIK